MKLVGKRIVVTGAASGIGRALVQQLLLEDATHILAVDRQAEGIPQGSRLTTLICDLSEVEGTDRVMEKALACMGGIDLYFANAGFAYYEKLGAPDWKRLEHIYSTNVLTPIYSYQCVRDLAAGQPFRVVITASAMGYLPIPGYAVYGATKASLVSFVEAQRWELADPCCLTLVNPIATRTRFFSQAKGKAPVPFPSQTPEQVARAMIRGVKADRADIFPSLIFRLVLVLNRLLPLIGWIYQKQQHGILESWGAAEPSQPAAPLDKSA